MLYRGYTLQIKILNAEFFFRVEKKTPTKIFSSWHFFFEIWPKIMTSLEKSTFGFFEFSKSENFEIFSDFFWKNSFSEIFVNSFLFRGWENIIIRLVGWKRNHIHVKSASAHRATATIDCGDPGPRVIDAGTERPVPTQPNPPSLHDFSSKKWFLQTLSNFAPLVAIPANCAESAPYDRCLKTIGTDF